MEVATNAVMIGFVFIIKPTAIPANEACAKVSPIIEYLLKTRKIPISGHNIEMRIEIIKAFCMKLYCNIFVVSLVCRNKFIYIMVRLTQMTMSFAYMIDKR